ncbi:tripeptidyl-peptidase [Achlya hypogyna]|uniref:subtilisin n=1 Tax=Achlya hypogyna TaxID=1202772 RepID=A0A1V9YQP0_ACHHY|nr:tripeptidyl-peptidase [Achlya hypogyna]
MRVLALGVLAMGAVAIEHAAWTRTGRADKHDLVDLAFALRPAVPGALAAQLKAISDVESPSYGQYLSHSEVTDLAAPNAAAIAAMDALLADWNSTRRGEYYHVSLPVEAVEALFDTELHVFRRSGRDVVRPHGSYVVPHSIREHVYLVDGLEHFPANFRLLAADSVQPANVAGGISLATIRQQYGLPTTPLASDESNHVTIGAFLKEDFSDVDLVQYYYRNGLTTTPLPHSRGCHGDGWAATGEASLDIQLVMGLTQNEHNWLHCYQQNRNASRPFGDDNQEPFLSFLVALQETTALETPPSVVSISYADDECAVPPEYIAAVDQEFIKAGLRGITIVVASGDNGVVGSTLIGFCGRPLCSRFETGYPASSPYVLSVGATQILPTLAADGAANREDVVTTDTGGAISSGSGYSWYADRPSYQDSVVRAYAGPLPPANLYRANGRVFPDVVAVGHNIPIIVNGRAELTDGTSASAPIVAAVVHQINQFRLNHGRGALGFANPLLYKLFAVCPGIFRDITVGKNQCGMGSQQCCAAGFSAAPGWDPLTGLGAIKFDAFVAQMTACEALVLTPQQLLRSPEANGDLTVYVAGGVVLVGALLAVFAVRARQSISDGAYQLMNE